jgi:hypothetical protein
MNPYAAPASETTTSAPASFPDAWRRRVGRAILVIVAAFAVEVIAGNVVGFIVAAVVMSRSASSSDAVARLGELRPHINWIFPLGDTAAAALLTAGAFALTAPRADERGAVRAVVRLACVLNGAVDASRAILRLWQGFGASAPLELCSHVATPVAFAACIGYGAALLDEVGLRADARAARVVAVLVVLCSVGGWLAVVGRAQTFTHLSTRNAITGLIVGAVLIVELGLAGVASVLALRLRRVLTTDCAPTM